MATNREVFKTLEERIGAFSAFCFEHMSCVRCPCFNVRFNNNSCALVWLKLEHKDGLKPCPFCGSTPVMADNIETMKSLSYYVRCACGVRTVSALSERAAAEMWNRRA